MKEIISDKEIDKVWGNANFGHNDRRGQILESLTQRAIGYHTGHTITCIMLELDLIQVKNLGVDFEEDIKSYHLTQKGLDYLLETKSQQRVNEVLDKAAGYARISGVKKQILKLKTNEK